MPIKSVESSINYYYIGKTDCVDSPNTHTYIIEIELFKDPGCTENVVFISRAAEHTLNITVVSLSGEDCTWEGTW